MYNKSETSDTLSYHRHINIAFIVIRRCTFRERRNVQTNDVRKIAHNRRSYDSVFNATPVSSINRVDSIVTESLSRHDGPIGDHRLAALNNPY